jgi:hypothetical protein
VNFGAVIVRLGPAGNVVWTRAYNGTPFVGGASGPTGLGLTANNQIVITSRVQLGAQVTQGFVLTRTDLNGNVVFSRVYQDSRFGASTFGSFTDVHELAGGALAVTGYTSRAGTVDTDTILARADGMGNFAVSRTLGPAQTPDFGTNLVPGVSPAGGVQALMVTGQRSAGTGVPGVSFLFRTDINVNLAWYRSFNLMLANNGLENASTNGDVVIPGTTTGLSNNGAALARFTSGGAFQWMNTYGGPGTDIGESVDVTPAGLLALGGFTNSWGNGLMDFYLVETNNAGQSGEQCEARLTPNINDVPPPIMNFQLLPLDRPESIALQWNGLPGQTRRVDACPAPCVPPPATMTAWFPLDELVGLRANDIIANNDGFWSGGPTPTPGVVAGALCFDGVNDLVRVPNNATINLGIGDLTIDAWVRTTNTNGVQIICDKRVNQQIRGYSLFLNNGQLGFQLADGAGFTNWVAGAAGFVADGSWHLVAVTVDRNNPTGGVFYVDGVAVSTFNPMSRMGNLNNNSSLVIGRRSFSNDGYFTGCIDELEIFKRALTAAEIGGLFNAGSAGKCKDTAVTPWDTAFCRNAQTVTTSVTICNNHSTPQTYSAAFNGLPVGPGCTIPGPTAFVPGVTFPITIPANTCQSFPVTIGRPAGMTAVYQVGCYEMVVSNLTSGETTIAHGWVQDRRDLCVTRGGGSSDLITLVPGEPLELNLAVENTTDGRLSGPFRIRVIGPDMEPDFSTISLNGLPPGQDLVETRTLPPNGIIAILIGLVVERPDFGSFFTLLLETDLDGDGTFEPLQSFDLLITPPSRCLGDYNADESVDGDDVIAFFTDWDNQEPQADVNEDDAVDGDDVITFFLRWDRGC